MCETCNILKMTLHFWKSTCIDMSGFCWIVCLSAVSTSRSEKRAPTYQEQRVEGDNTNNAWANFDNNAKANSIFRTQPDGNSSTFPEI